MRLDLLVRTKTSTTHLFQAAIANANWHRRYDPVTREFIGIPGTYVVTACGQILSTNVTIKPAEERLIHCGDCRSLFRLLKEGVDVSDDVIGLVV